ncbi:hypothetical protein BUE80_DR013583, partial [Diplocarpon rosae]
SLTPSGSAKEASRTTLTVRSAHVIQGLTLTVVLRSTPQSSPSDQMAFIRPRSIALLLCAALMCVYAEKHSASIAAMSIPEVEEALQECALVQELNTYKLATSPPTSTLTSRIFGLLFPGSPATNALLATLYISGPPNFLLALCPPNIDPASLSVMVAFAVGGLLGDTLFHLLPEIFLGEDAPEHVRFVLVEPNRNLLLGLAILVGFVTFVAMDKGLRIATGGGSHGHDHGHAHGTVEGARPAGSTSALEESPAKGVRSRQKSAVVGSALDVAKDEKEINASVKLAGYLNLIWGDLLLPFTAGTFLYVGTVAVIPELLETGPERAGEVWKTGKQFLALATGAGIML